MKLYKLTDRNVQTYGGCQWGEGVEHTASGEGDLCDSGWLHAYTHPLLAVLLNPIYGNFRQARMWEAEGIVGKEDRGLEVGCTRLKTIREVPMPEVTTEQHVRFAIACTLQVYDESSFVDWAKNWLSGKDRAEASASARAEAAAEAAASEAAEDTTWWSWAAEVAEAAAEAATDAAAPRTLSAWAAASVWDDIPLAAIAEWAVTNEPFESLERLIRKDNAQEEHQC